MMKSENHFSFQGAVEKTQDSSFESAPKIDHFNLAKVHEQPASNHTQQMMHSKLLVQSRGHPQQSLTNTYKITENIQDVADNRMLLLMSENRMSLQRGSHLRDPFPRGPKNTKNRNGKYKQKVGFDSSHHLNMAMYTHATFVRSPNQLLPDMK